MKSNKIKDLPYICKHLKDETCANVDCAYCGKYCPTIEHPSCCAFSYNVFSDNAIIDLIINSCADSIVSNSPYLHRTNINTEQEMITGVYKFTVDFILTKSDCDKMYKEILCKLKKRYKLNNGGVNQ